MSNKIAIEALKSELRESAIIMANLPIEFGVACITDAGAQRISKAMTDAVAALEAGGWLPIASAPKSSKTIIVYCAERKNTYTVTWWRDEEFPWSGKWKHSHGDYLSETPTHWMPLPTPPKEAP